MAWRIASQTSRNCAFCKNWYDPANSVLRRKNTKMWEYNTQIQSICDEKKLKTFSEYTCSKFVSKI